MPHVLVAGYFGSGNLGDDAILVGFAHGLAGTGIDMSVMSGAPEETFRTYGYTAVPRMDQNAIGAAIARADALVFAGGGIFQDSTSVRSVAYYASLVKKAKKAGKKVIMLAQGVGPLKSILGKPMAKSAFNGADVITVRDPGSLSALKALGVTRPTRVTADMAFLLPDKTGEEGAAFTLGDMRSVGLSPRPWKGKQNVVALFGETARLLSQANMMPILIEMDRKVDGPLLQEISKQQGGKIPDLRKQQTPMQLEGRMARMDAIIAMRLHAGILATLVGVPPLMVSYDPKVAAFSKLLDIGNALNMENLTAQRLFETFMAFQKERERNVKVMQRKRDELRTAAQTNIDVLKDALGIRETVNR